MIFIELNTKWLNRLVVNARFDLSVSACKKWGLEMGQNQHARYVNLCLGPVSMDFQWDKTPS